MTDKIKKSDSESIEISLFRTDPKEYSDAYTEHLIEQYKLYVQSHEKISERRQQTNTFFLTLNTFLMGGVGYILDKETDYTSLLLIGVGIGVLFCYFWYRIIRSYDGLNTGKFVVIHAIEKRLPLALYETEWGALGGGKDSLKYLPFTHIEKKIPVVFMLGYIFLISFFLLKQIIIFN